MIVLTSCQENVAYRDEFYNNGNQGYPRLPLIEPYEMVNISGSFWQMDLIGRTIPTRFFISFIDSVFVNDDYIYIFLSEDRGKMSNEEGFHYYLIDAKNRSEQAFTQLQSFNDYLSQNELSQPDWRSIDDCWDHYKETGLLYWKKSDIE